MPSDFIPGAPGWFDVTSPDIPATAEFYGALFGWTARDTGPDNDHYTLFLQDDALVAGIVTAATPDGGSKPAVWLPYFAVTDCKAAVATAVDAGAGVFIGPTNAGGAAEFAVLTDPDGAPYCVSQPLSNPGTERFRAVNNPCWVQYAAVRNPAEAMSHYAKVLGWHYENAAWETAAENPYQALTAGGGGGEFGGAALAAPGQPAPFWSVTFRVADTDATAARAAELGGTVVQEPQDMPGPSRLGVLADQAGAAFAIMSVQG
ncbi:VOC family protein [Nocardia sp. NPDC020380]|uniref:VOC family protein n=1 Tax=Nocardia sp. NPDC020380 TaxID=3364309 RepID=UPI003789D84E